MAEGAFSVMRAAPDESSSAGGRAIYGWACWVGRETEGELEIYD